VLGPRLRALQEDDRGRCRGRRGAPVSPRIEFYAPAGEITAQLLHDFLLLTGPAPSPEKLARLSRLERLLAYDWAAREHLRAADHPVRQRPRPSFLEES
jgi:hypothetical protein